MCYDKNYYMRSGNILLIAVTIMDFITAVLILSNTQPLDVARLGIFYQLFSIPYIGALLMLLSVGLAVYGLLMPVTSSFKRFLLFIPQQLFLLMNASSAIDFIILQHYADGVLRPWPFILQDQLPSIVLAFGYFFAMIDMEKKRKVI